MPGTGPASTVTRIHLPGIVLGAGGVLAARRVVTPRRSRCGFRSKSVVQRCTSGSAAGRGTALTGCPPWAPPNHPMAVAAARPPPLPTGVDAVRHRNGPSTAPAPVVRRRCKWSVAANTLLGNADLLDDGVEDSVAPSLKRWS